MFQFITVSPLITVFLILVNAVPMFDLIRDSIRGAHTNEKKVQRGPAEFSITRILNRLTKPVRFFSLIKVSSKYYNIISWY